MLTPEQHAIRRTGITSTDITRIVNESPFGGPADVYLEKITELPPGAPPFPQRPSTLPQRIGDYLEPLVCELVGELHGLELAPGETVRHPMFPWAITTPDRFVTNAPALVEAKVKSILFNRSEWEQDEPPGFVAVQAQWHLAVTRRQICYIGALLGATPRFWTIEHDEDFASMLLEAGQQFHEQHVLARVPPPPDGSDGWRRLAAHVWAKARKGSTIRATAENEIDARRYFEATARLQELEQRKELAAQYLIEACGEHERIEGDGWRLILANRSAVEVPAHTKKGYRHFDLRPSKKGEVT